MTITMLKAKIHRATVTQAELDYVGSITVDMDLLEQAGILEYEKVQIVDVNNGSRFETYTIAGERGSGVTLACGTGSCAALVAANLCGLAGREAEIELDGGTLLDRWDEQTGRVLMTGPAAFVFDGEYEA